ncbi:MAG: HAD family phosphatase [Leptolinea sp.]
MEKTQPAIQAVIFDMGGVILRSESVVSRTKLAKKFGLTRKELENIVFQSDESKKAELGEFTAEQHWNNIARLLNFPQAELAEFQRAYWDGDQVDEELVAFIRGLRGKYKTGMLSNAWHGARERIMAEYHFLSAFDAVIFSADVHLRKPDPRIFLLMLARLGVKVAEAVFVDDFMENIEGARAVGLQTVLFKTREGVIRELKEMGVG